MMIMRWNRDHKVLIYSPRSGVRAASSSAVGLLNMDLTNHGCIVTFSWIHHLLPGTIRATRNVQSLA